MTPLQKMVSCYRFLFHLVCAECWASIAHSRPSQVILRMALICVLPCHNLHPTWSVSTEPIRTSSRLFPSDGFMQFELLTKGKHYEWTRYRLSLCTPNTQFVKDNEENSHRETKVITFQGLNCIPFNTTRASVQTPTQCYI